MSGKRNLRTSFAVQSKHEAFYTGGRVMFTEDGGHVLCHCSDRVNLLHVESGTVLHSFGQEEDGEITSYTISPDDKILVIALRNLLLKQFDFDKRELTRTWKAIHQSPVSCMGFDKTSTLLATGGADASIKIWDVIQQYCTHNLRGHRGVVNVVKYHPNPERLELLSAGEDYIVRVWDLRTSTCTGLLEGHYSVITGIHFSPDSNTLYSCGRDKVVNVWNMKTKTKTRTIPVYETVEGMILLGDDEDYSELGADPEVPHFITAGSKGVLRVWNAQTSQCVYPPTEGTSEHSLTGGSTEPSQNITDVIYSAALEAVITVSYDHNISLHSRRDFSLKKQLAGYNDDILDVKYLGSQQSHVVVATNSELIKVFELSTWAVQILPGHTDTVLALDVCDQGNLFASSSKDNSIRVWRTSDDVRDIQCVAKAYGHTKAILALTFSRLSASFLVSGGEDLTIKVWNLPPEPGSSSESVQGSCVGLSARLTEKAHDKDINSVALSPNDKLLATGSQDKTAKLWSTSSLQLLGVFRGHRRGVWCVQFSPVDQCLATASSDGSVKLWALSDHTCIQTFEGHDALVLRVQFINHGMQLLSCGSDGLLKLWTVRTSECVKTLEEHNARIWALAVNKDETQVTTGGADSTVILWKDVTETEVQEERGKQVDFILKEQKLLNLIQQKKYIKALALAVLLEQPFRVLNIMKDIMAEPEDRDSLRKILPKLRADQIDAVLRFSAQWNTNSKHCHVAQHVLQTLLQYLSPERLLELPNARSSLEALLPYTQKHMERLSRLYQQATFVGYTWNTIKLASQSDNVMMTSSDGNDNSNDNDNAQTASGLSKIGRLDRRGHSESGSLGVTGSNKKSESRDSGSDLDSESGDDSSSEKSDKNISVCMRVKARTSQQGIPTDSGSESDSEEQMDFKETKSVDISYLGTSNSNLQIDSAKSPKRKNGILLPQTSEDSDSNTSASDMVDSGDISGSSSPTKAERKGKRGSDSVKGAREVDAELSTPQRKESGQGKKRPKLVEKLAMSAHQVKRERPSDVRRSQLKRRRKSAA